MNSVAIVMVGVSLLVGTPPPTVIPAAIVVSTSRGQATVPVSVERGHAVLPVPQLSTLLPVTARVESNWAVVEFANQPFRFLLDGPAFVYQGRVIPLVGGAYEMRDTIFVPLQWLSGYIPQVFPEGYRYDPYAARFEEARFTPVVASAVSPPRTRYRVPEPGSAAARNGFRMVHKVVVDAGHGGADPGNPGRHLPRGVKEKDITLAMALRLRDQLEKRGVNVIMTRDSDRAVRLYDRAPMCQEDCQLFVSIHVNSLARRPGYEATQGFETYYLSEARTAEAARVAKMENEALRYETGVELGDTDPLAFIFKDLHSNENLRESAELADLVQAHAARVHPGKDRGISQAGLAVLSTARRPAILVETGFATNPGDARYLASASGQRDLASAMADGIVAYLRQFEKKILGGAVP